MCHNGSFLEEGGSILCQKCIPNAECQGGYIPLIPQKEYSRKGNNSLDFHYCHLNPSTCLGNDTCKQGYQGILCKGCQVSEGNFYRTHNLEC